MFHTNSRRGGGVDRCLLVLLGIGLIPVVLGQWWGNGNGNGNTYTDYGNYNYQYPQYQGVNSNPSATSIPTQSSSNTNNNNDSDEDMDEKDVQFMKNYLHKYEYLPQLRSPNDKEDPEELREAVMRLQRMAGLPPTGILNNQTLTRIRDSKRCGNSDKPVDLAEMRKRRYAIQHGWSKRKLTWAIKNFTPDIARATTNRVIASAFQVWSDVARLDFQETRFPKADIIVLFARDSHGDGYSFDGVGGTLAHAYFPGDGIGGDVHFDEDEMFTDRTKQGTNLFIVAAHEIGHSLGLAHSEVSGSLMAPYYQGFQTKFNLPKDDIRGIQSLYGARSTPPNRPRPPTGGGGGGGGGQPNIPSNGPKDRTVCNTPISAVAYGSITGQPTPALYIFSGEQFWVKQGREPVTNAMQTESYFTEMQSPPDAAFIGMSRGQRRMVFFSGTEIWEFSQGVYQARDIRERTGIRTNGIDAAFRWNRNKKIYVFYRNLYWRLNENSLRADPGYPRVIKDNWRGRTGSFDAVWSEGKDAVSYFLMGRQVQTFRDNEVFFVTPTRSFASDWLMCGQNIGSGSNGPITASLTLLVASTIAALKHVL